MTAAPPRDDRFRFSMLEGVRPLSSVRLSREALAGLTLAALAIPEVMGYTKIAGMPVITGLYTLLIPAALFAIFGSSRHLVVGADSATAAILAAGLIGVASARSDEYVALASLLALMAAGLLLLARVVGLGFMADFLSRTVLIGFLTGIGIQVALGQVAGMLGLEGGGHGALPKVWTDLREIGETNPYALGTSLAVIALVIGARLISRRIPGALIAVVGAIVAGWAFNLDAHMHALGTVPRGLPHIGLPKVDWSLGLIGKLAPTAFAMFIVILAQSAATSRAYAARYDERCSENTDLFGLTLANIGAGLSGTFVVNGSPTKTQMVDGAGGRTQLSLLVTSGTVLVVLVFATRPLEFLPSCVLSAIVFLIGLDLIDVRGMRRVYANRRSEFWVALITTGAVVLVGVEQGILLAIVLSLIDHTRRGYRPRNALLVPGETGAWRPEPVASGAQAMPGLMIYRFNHSMYYANSEQLAEEIGGLVRDPAPPLRWFCIDASAVDDIDFTAAETLATIRRQLQSRGVRLVIAQLFDESGAARHGVLCPDLANVARFATLEDAVVRYREEAAAQVTDDARRK